MVLPMPGLTSLLLVAPVAVPLATAALGLLARSRFIQQWVTVVGTAIHLIGAAALFLVVEREGILVERIGNWPAPFAIVLVADLFSAAMVVVAALLGFLVTLYSGATVDEARQRESYYPMLAVLLAGVSGSFVTGDLFNLYVWFEVMLIASFVLLALGGERPQLEGALKYVALNLLSSALLLSAVGILYGLVGTLNMADLADRLGTVAPSSGLLTPVAILLLVAFGIKAALFPFFFWLPASYHTPPVAVSAIFAGLLTKVGVYALVRLFTLLFGETTTGMSELILLLAGLTMLTGVLGALAQREFRRVLSFHIVSQIGYMIMGLGLLSVAGVAATVYYIVHHILVKTNLFLVAGAIVHLRGTGELGPLGGLYARQPGLAVLFLVSAMSLAGVPPFSGFIAKLALVQAGLAANELLIVAVALAVSLLTLLSMLKLWNEAFWKSPPAPLVEEGAGPPADRGGRLPARVLGPMIALAACTIGLTVLAEPAMQVSLRAADTLLHPEAYLRAVLGTDR